MSVATLVKSIQDIMRKDTGVDGDAQRISQIVWMIFMKIFDDREKEWELMSPEYTSPIPSRFRWRNWASNPEGMTGAELVDFINNDLFPGLRNLAVTAGADARARVVGAMFEDGYNYMKNGTLLRQVANKIEEDVDFTTRSDRHLLGDIYEKILKDLQSAGNAGEYYTPRAVTQFIVAMVDPRLGETILDPACGTGGFLTCAIDYLSETTKQIKTAEDKRIMEQSLRGIEKKPLPHMLTTTNMLLHGIDDPSFIHRDNYLAKPYTSWGPNDRVNCIITNPPFGGMEEDGTENNFPRNLRTRETADLFLALLIRLLKSNGRAGIVLPDGTLFGEGVKTRIKEHLLTECNLHTIVRLPNGVFAPYTGIKTNLLFFTKGEPTKNIWYYEHPYPEGVTSYNKTNPMRFEEFQPETDWWGEESDGFASRVENEHAWKVSIDNVKARNYNLDIKNPHEGELINYDPDELLADFAKQRSEIRELRDQLKNILGDALENDK
ncbi:MAG: SAM-dependent DNA methyltransferase [Kiritimatiellaeota bacterium]|nr:SAM-dependent DNA methyltransferase [Kiritimatiellota bacterium]